MSSLKANASKRPNLLGLSPDGWFLRAQEMTGAKVLAIDEEIALETARVPAVYGSGDPGGCFLIATARVRGLVLMTRDRRMLELAAAKPEYVSVFAC